MEKTAPQMQNAPIYPSESLIWQESNELFYYIKEIIMQSNIYVEALKGSVINNNKKSPPKLFNQSINFYSANIPGEASLSGATAKSVFNSKTVF